MAILILDPAEAKEIRDKYVVNGGTSDERLTEMWEGVEVMTPMANNEHFRIVSRLNSIFSSVIDWDNGDQCLPGGNVSDRDEGWEHNYRNPDVLVVLRGNITKDHGTHWVGGPDLVVEVLSPGEEPKAKFDFYSRIGVREILIVARDPWAMELFALRNGSYQLTGRSESGRQTPVVSTVLPLSLRLTSGRGQQIIEVIHTITGQRWTA